MSGVTRISFQTIPYGKQRSAIRFGRALDTSEQKDAKAAIAQSRAWLRTHHLGKGRLMTDFKDSLILLPHRAVRADAADKTLLDYGLGNYLDGAGPLAKQLSAMGYTAIQDVPAGILNETDLSPYTGSLFSRDLFGVSLNVLVTLGLLPKADLQHLAQMYQDSEEGQQNHLANAAVKKQYTKCLHTAFENAKSQGFLANEGYQAFKTKNQEWLQKDALYEVLSQHVYQGQDFYKNWTGPNAYLDKNLFSTSPLSQAKQERINYLNQEYQLEIEFYQFVQYLAFAQHQEAKGLYNTHGIKLLGDRQVILSNRDVWANQSLFLNDLFMGAPEGEDGIQEWGAPIIAPHQLFDFENGEIKRLNLTAPGSQFLARMTEHMCEQYDGMRIDHLLGLIDPFVYNVTEQGQAIQGRRLYDNLNMPEAVYGDVVEKIILEAAKRKGVSSDNIIAEDLGPANSHMARVMEKLGLANMRMTRWASPTNDYKGIHQKSAAADQETQRPNTILATGYLDDHIPLLEWLKTNVLRTKGGYNPYGMEKVGINGFDPNKPDQEVTRLATLFPKLTIDSGKNYALGRFMEVIGGNVNRVASSFCEWMGITAPYNLPGSVNVDTTPVADRNWSARMQPLETYYQNLRDNEGAINPFEAHANVLENWGCQDAALLEKLNRLARILAE